MTSINEGPFGAFLFRFNKALHLYLNSKFEEYGLSVIQGLFLIRFYHFPHTTQQQLAEIFYLSKGAVAKSLRFLEDNGFIERSRCEDNRRQYKINLTDKAIGIIPTLKAINLEWEDEMELDNIDSEFFEIFKKLTEKSIKLNEGKL